ncbi:hypothetical protein ACFQLX_12120 [Streptomyces polyrhachis]|uniref:L,D-transpeptidase n=1 Tax=Streptomyces polyrhachis TaxID=1282885 RepID=A0ABW2GDP3_9ACTN
MARRSNPGTFVAVLTAAALAVVGFLAFQAGANEPEPGEVARSSAPAGESSAAPGRKGAPTALPANSGSGKRVVYALGAERVWLVGQDGSVRRTYEVTPSSVSPVPGKYRVSTRSNEITGSDGVRIEHVVRFTSVGEVVIGFSSAVDGSTAPPADGKRKTGGIRSARANGDAMWSFAGVGTPVVVVR